MSLLNITQAHLKGEPRRIGNLEGNPVYLLVTKGGLHVILAKIGTKAKALASGPHIGIAKAMAQQMYPDLVITELSKSEAINLEHYSHLVPILTDLTNRINAKLEE